MPITPFHFGPGLLFRGISRHVSLSAFVVANCLIDIEPILGFLINGDPAHRFMHTYLGATIAALLTALLTRPYAERWLRYWNTKLSPAQAKWLGCQETISVTAYWIGAFVGAWSHIWLDAFMHVDVEAWWPFASGNTQQGLIPIDGLHVLCLVAGVIGLLLLAWSNWVRTSPRFAAIKRWGIRIAASSLVVGIGFFYHSLISAGERMETFCGQLVPGMASKSVIEAARGQGIKYYASDTWTGDKSLILLVDTRSFVRHACDVELENGVVRNTEFRFAD